MEPWGCSAPPAGRRGSASLRLALTRTGEDADPAREQRQRLFLLEHKRREAAVPAAVAQPGIWAGSPFPCQEMLPAPLPLPQPTPGPAGPCPLLQRPDGRGAGPQPQSSSQTHTETREEMKAHLTCENTSPKFAAAGEGAVGVALIIVRKAINIASPLF